MVQRMQVVALGWHMYEKTGATMAIALIGLSSAVPSFLTTLPAGQLADRWDRRKLLLTSVLIQAIAAIALLAVAVADLDARFLYLGSFIAAIATAINRPARSSILPGLVPAELLPGAVAWSAGFNQVATIAGPSVTGLLIAATGGPLAAYGAVAAGAVLALLFTLRLPPQKVPKASGEARGFQHMMAGMMHIVRTPVLVSSISMDTVQVIFCGATGLLPVFAKDILHGGPEVLGWLASAPAVGAITTIFVVNHMPHSERPGLRFILAVMAYGSASVIFGLSTSLALSLIVLFIMGSMNSISSITRNTVLQAYTPGNLRGRVSAANHIFASTTTELGQFQAGAMATLTNPVIAVVAGSAFTVLYAGFIAWRVPSLRRLASLTLK